MKKIKPAITVGMLGMVLTVGICVQLKTINAADISGTIQLTDSNLKKSLLQWKSRYEESNKKLEDTEEKLIELRSTVANLGSDEETKQKIQKYQTILGMTDVQGEGIIITVADNTQISSGDSFSSINNSNYIVHDGNRLFINHNSVHASTENNHRIHALFIHFLQMSSLLFRIAGKTEYHERIVSLVCRPLAF